MTYYLALLFFVGGMLVGFGIGLGAGELWSRKEPLEVPLLDEPPSPPAEPPAPQPQERLRPGL